MLASAFLQPSLTPNTLGFIGLLVLLSSLVKQYYHPDVRARIAAQKAARLQALIRDTDDRIITIQTGENGDEAKALLALVKQVTSAPNEIDDYLLPLAGETGRAPTPGEAKAAKAR